MIIFAKQLVDFTIHNLEDFLRLGASATLPSFLWYHGAKAVFIMTSIRFERDNQIKNGYWCTEVPILELTKSSLKKSWLFFFRV